MPWMPSLETFRARILQIPEPYPVLPRHRKNFNRHPADPSKPGEWNAINDAVTMFLRNNWIEVCGIKIHDGYIFSGIQIVSFAFIRWDIQI